MTVQHTLRGGGTRASPSLLPARIGARPSYCQIMVRDKGLNGTATILILSSESLRRVTSLIWANHLPSLCLCFFSHKVEACISYLRGRYEDQVS